jgi:hypothetical protein
MSRSRRALTTFSQTWNGRAAVSATIDHTPTVFEVMASPRFDSVQEPPEVSRRTKRTADAMHMAVVSVEIMMITTL